MKTSARRGLKYSKMQPRKIALQREKSKKAQTTQNNFLRPIFPARPRNANRGDSFRVAFENVDDETPLPRSEFNSRHPTAVNSESEKDKFINKDTSVNRSRSVNFMQDQNQQNLDSSKPIQISRNIYDSRQIHSEFGDLGLQLQMSYKEQLENDKSFIHKATFMCRRPLDWLKIKIPIFKWIPEYFANPKEEEEEEAEEEEPQKRPESKKWYKKLMSEIVPGFLVGVMGVPEGISFSFLAGVSPEHGVYTSIFPPIWYMFLGTSKHAAIGTYALTTLLIGFCVKTWAPFDDSDYDHLEFGTQHLNGSVPSDVDTSPWRPIKDKFIIPEDPHIPDHGPISEEMKEIYQKRASYASCLALVSGIMMFIFGSLRLGFLFNYFSDPLIAGLTAGGSIQVLFSQIPEITGLHIVEHFGPFNIIYNVVALVKEYADISKHDQDKFVMSLITIGIFMASVLVLFIFDWLEHFLEHSFEKHKELHREKVVEHMEMLKQFEDNKNKGIAEVPRIHVEIERHASDLTVNSDNSALQPHDSIPEKPKMTTTFFALKQITRFPLPTEFILVALMIFLGYILDMNARWDVEMVGAIPPYYPNIPAPISFPERSEEHAVGIFGMSFLITIVGYFASVALMKVMAEDRNYKIDPNQELLALGIANIISAFFGCFPAFINLARTCVFFEAGAESQISAALSVIVMLIFKEATSPVFEYCPKACLAAIVWFSVYKIYNHLEGIKKLLTIDKLDGLVWIISAISVVLLDIVLGLSTGLLCCIFSVVIRSQMAEAIVLAKLGETEIYEDHKKYCRNSHELDGVKIIKYLAPLHYINREQFRKEIDRCSGYDSYRDKRRAESEFLNCVILDCGSIAYVDYGGIKELADIIGGEAS